MNIKRNTREPFVAILLVLIMVLSVFSAMCTSASAATDEEIQKAIDDGVVWLVAQQNSVPGPNYGSWNAYGSYLGAGTGLALYKLEDRAYELGYDSPFDPNYEYHQNVEDGLNWTFANLAVVDINDQDHTTGATGTVDNPDTNGNGIGVCYSGSLRIYKTGILLTAISASGTPDRVVNVPGSPVDGWTYKNVAQDMVDYLAFGQVDPSIGPSGYIHEGGWDYFAVDNGTGGSGWQGDQSNSGYVVLGLAEAENFGCIVPDWVKTELNVWIDHVQDDVTGDTNDGGSWYSYPPGGPSDSNGDFIGVNILKTGNLISEMAFVGDAPNAPRVTNATDYLVRHWNDTSGADSPPGWNGTPAQYQTMFTTMKGLEYMGIDTFDGIDWFEEFSDVIVAQQDKTAGPTNGSWQSSSGRGEPVIITIWALLTLEKVAPPPPINPSIDIEKSTNGEDADVAPGPRIRSGREVTWTYNVTNNGTVILNNIIVIDDMLGEITCPSTTLQPGESMVCTAIGTAWVGQYSNLGTVTAVYEGVTSDNGRTIVSDSDQSHYFGYNIGEPNFEVPTANPFLTAGVLGIAIVLFLRRELK